MPGPIGLIDASIYFFRGYFGMPERWFDRRGVPSNAVYTFARVLAQALSAHPRRLAVAFDESLGTCFRHAIWPAYKANRVPPDDAVRAQFRHCRALCELLGVPHYGGPEFEADDYLASLTRRALQGRGDIYIYSKDKDLRQLLSDRVNILEQPGGTRMDRSTFEHEWAFPPRLWPDYQALVGDSSDNVPGVHGVGERSARLLIGAYGPLESVLASPGHWARDGLRLARPAQVEAALAADGARALDMRRVLRLRRDVPLGRAPFARRGSGRGDTRRHALDRWLVATGLARPLAAALRSVA
ncbi:MAG: 5'-3' exonuclease H3TH domain-containing protein [Pseudomonadota bacterium]